MAAEASSVNSLAAPGGPLQREMLCDHCKSPMISNAGRRGEPRCESGEDVRAVPVPRWISSSGTDVSCTGEDRLELRLVLIGSTGAGESATGNSILRREVFESKPSAVPVTKECQRGEGEWEGIPLVVVDTPDFLRVPEKELSAKIKRCRQLSFPGAHALLLVLRAEQVNNEERESVQRIQRLFGKEALKFTVIVFTRKENLGDKTIDTFVRHSEPKLRELVKRCGGRVCAFNNRAKGAEREQQVRELIQMICKMVAGNEGRYHRLGQDLVEQDFWQKICKKL